MRGYIVEFVPLVGPEFPGPLWAHSWMEKRFTEDDDVVEVIKDQVTKARCVSDFR